MVSFFKEKFFSVAGQKERLLNVKEGLKIAYNPFDRRKVEVNPAIPKIIQKPIQYVAGHGVETSLAVLGAGTAAGRKVVTSLAKALVPKTAGGKIAASSAALFGAGVLAKSQTARDVAVNIASHTSPTDIIGQGGYAGELIEKKFIPPIKEAFTEGGKYTAAGVAIAGAVVGGGLLIDKLSSKSESNQVRTTKLTAEDALSATPANVAGTAISPPPKTVDPPYTSPPAALTGTSRAVRKRKKHKFIQPMKQSVKVYNIISNRNY